MQTLYHKKNELFEVEFFADKECTQAFDFTNAKDLYIVLKDGDAMSLLALDKICPDDRRIPTTRVFIPYLVNNVRVVTNNLRFTVLDDITPNLSKYIPEDNAVLFLSEEDKSKFSVNEFSQNVFNRTPLVSQYWIDRGDFPRNLINGYFNDNNSTYTINDENKGVHPIYRKLTIFLSHGTQSELQKAEKVAKELKEKYGVEEVNLFVLHCFVKYDILHYEILNIDESDYFSKTPEEAFEYMQNTLDCDDDDYVEKLIKGYDDEFRKDFEKKKNNFFKSLPINKIITTNSTGILEPQNTERLQVIDCKEIFEEYLKESN